MSRCAVLLLTVALAATTRADPTPFDLAGPSLEVRVTRGAVTLPISQVPNLAAGDHLAIKSMLPATQEAHYLLVAAFLRGATNPPPKDWFFRCKTWTHECKRDGLAVTVPQEAQQVLVFLAPETGGDFKTLVDAVRGRPGAFVRASQDLNQATLDRSRLQDYLAAIRLLDAADPALLKQSAPLLARSLAIKVDAKCLEKTPELQAPCLMQGQESLILDDGHSTSIVEALTSGPVSDLAMEASFTPQLSYGYYSPYIASVLDIARIMSSFSTAQYQYIPALASLHDDQLDLTLNAAPSFRNPKSVLVAALPPVERELPPPLHAVNSAEAYCARKPSLVLPVEGAPLVFSTAYLHGLSLTLSAQDGKSISLPAKADAQRGGLVIDTSSLRGVPLDSGTRASLRGYWGFDAFEGPGFQLVTTRGQQWELPSAQNAPLIVGRAGTVHLHAGSLSCVEDITLKDSEGKQVTAAWKRVRPDEADVTLPLQQTTPGSITLVVSEYGAEQPRPIPLQTFSEPGRLDSFAIRTGDSQGVLRGTRLDQVAGLVMRNILFVPGKLTSGATGDELSMDAPDNRTAAALKQGDIAKAKVTLKDGRVIDLQAAVDPPRPKVELIGKDMQPATSVADTHVILADPEELPQDDVLTFSLRARIPAVFLRDETIEVATADGSYSSLLNVANGGVILENSHVAVATFDPKKSFGGSAFGPLQFRVTANGVPSEWQPLATLVRLPELHTVECPATPELACKLSGSNLFLLDSVANDSKFDHSVQVPDGFPGNALPVPHPSGEQLYVKLRDDPSVVSRASLAPQQLSPSTEESARAAARQAAATSALEAGPGVEINPPSSPNQPPETPVIQEVPEKESIPPQRPAEAVTVSSGPKDSRVP